VPSWTVWTWWTADTSYPLARSHAPAWEPVGNSECRRARDAKRDIPVPLSPCARATTCTCRGRPAPGPRLRHFAPPPDPYDEWLDGVSDALASGLRQLRDLRPLRHFGQPLAPTPTADYPPRASRFPGGQRPRWIWPRRSRPCSTSITPMPSKWYSCGTI